MAEHAISTPAPLGDRYIPATVAVTVRFRLRNRQRQLIAGTLKGAMLMRGAVHHYRVAGENGIFYLAPAAWFPPGHVEWFTKAAFAPATDLARAGRQSPLMDLIMDIKAHLDARDGVTT